MSARLDTLTSWHADWSGLKVAVLGLGVTGFAVADTLAELGARVTVLTSKHDEDRSRILSVLGVDLVEDPLEDTPAALVEFAPDLVIASPGFHPDHPVLEWAQASGIAVWGDIELAWRLRDKVGPAAEWILVTGTNGKTTTTQLAATMLAEHGLRVAPCGNIGIPVLDALRDPAGWDVLVVELSSYQLHHIPLTGPGALHPVASVCLNIAADHLDWHGSFEGYRDAKATVYANTRVACVYNKADERTRVMVEEADVAEGARAIGFDLGVPGRSDFGLVEGILCDRAFLDDRASTALELITVSELREVGLDAPHVVANILAASALARSVGVPPETIRQALLNFQMDAHRIHTVRTHANVRWVNDSKATNAHAADASLRAFNSVVWILGGQLKGVDISSLVSSHADRLTAAIIIGAERDVIREAFERHAPALPVVEVDAAHTGEVMALAVARAAGFARENDTVLLAPAAASFDQFASYEDRGRQFEAAVVEFLEGGEHDNDSPSPKDTGAADTPNDPGV